MSDTFHFPVTLHAADARPFAVVAVAGKEIRGRRFSREALEESLPLWAGDPIMLGNHLEADFGLVADHRVGAKNPVVGRVKSAELVGDELRLYPEFKPTLANALEGKGVTLASLSGVSLEAIVNGTPDNSRFGFTNGFVMLTDSTGACTTEDGCRLVACAGGTCNCSEGRTTTMDNETTAAAETLTKDDVEAIVASAVQSAIKANGASSETAALFAADDEPKTDDDAVPASDSVTISRKDFEQLRSMAGAFREHESKTKDDLIQRLMRLSVYKDANRVELEGKDVPTLTEILRVATEAGAKPETAEDRDHILTAHRKAIAPIHGLDSHVATVEPVKPPPHEELQKQIAERWGR